MYQLKKLLSLKGYRAYSNYSWDKTTPEFRWANVLFGWNATGKSSFADFLMELGSKDGHAASVSYDLLFQNEDRQTIHLTEKNGALPDRSIVVYDQNYVERNIENVDPLKHIFAVGEEHIDAIDKRNRLLDEIKVKDAQVQALLIKKETLNKRNEQILSKHASFIKNELVLGNYYNRNVFSKEYEDEKSKVLLSGAEYPVVRSTALSATLPILNALPDLFVINEFHSYIFGLLSTQPVIKAISELNEHPELADWAFKGIELHEKYVSTNCFFCGNEITQQRLDSLAQHFNKEFKQLSEKLERSIERLSQIKTQYTQVQDLLYLKEQFYPSLQNTFETQKSKLIESCRTCINILDKIIQILEKKQKDITSPEYSVEFNELKDITILSTNLTEQINQTIDENNSLTRSHNTIVADSISRIKQHWFKIFSDEIESSKADSDVVQNEYSELVAQLQINNDQVMSITLSLKNSTIPAQVMNREISLFFGRNDIQFREVESGYVLDRKGAIAKNLSKGEKNAIALVYFFNSLSDMSIRRDNSIIILDDPISSFDSSYYYYATAYIRKQIEDVGQAFILTHKFSFFKDICKMLEGKSTGHYVFERDTTGIKIQTESPFLRDYMDEYVYLFKHLINYSRIQQPTLDESLAIANLARKALESYLTFKVPNNSNGIEKVRTICNDLTVSTRAICRLLNNHSHLKIIQDQDKGDNLEIIQAMPSIVDDLLRFMFSNDKLHFRTLLECCKIEPESIIKDDDLDFSLSFRYHTKLYDWSVAAGVSSLPDDNITFTMFPTQTECDYAVRVCGSSMEPDIFDGDIILVDKCNSIPINQRGIFSLNGELICKRLINRNDKLTLKSDNKDKDKYPDREVGIDDSLVALGRIIKVIHNSTLV